MYIYIYIMYVYIYIYTPGCSEVKASAHDAGETWVQSLGRKDPLEKEMATHSSILAWGIPWTEEPSGLESMGCKESDTTE